MANHLIGIVYDVDGDGMSVAVENGLVEVSYTDGPVIAGIYNAQRARALAAMLHAAADHVERQGRDVTQPTTG